MNYYITCLIIAIITFIIGFISGCALVIYGIKKMLGGMSVRPTNSFNPKSVDYDISDDLDDKDE